MGRGFESLHACHLFKRLEGSRQNVPQVRSFHMGGYQVCEKWLKDRRGRTLTYDDLEHYCKVVTALHETIRLMAEIDATIPKWPIE